MLVFLSLLLASCAGPPTSGPGSAQEPLTVAAAADLGPASEALTALYRERTSRQLRFVIGASGMLARQIDQGAPYDLFLSANLRYVDELAKAGKVRPESVRVYAVGRLGVWWKGGPIAEAKQLLRPEIRHLALANPSHAPYGEAAKDYLERAELWTALEPKIVYGENVRQAAQFASSGNAEALISSWTLVKPMGGTLIPAEQHAPIRQAGAVVTASARYEEAIQLLGLLLGEEAQALLREHGLDSPVAASPR